MKVITLGPSLDEKGGMGSVGTLIINTAPADVQIEHISTWDGEASRNSSLHRLKAFARAWATLSGKLLRNEVDLVHIHMAEKGSVLRKALLLLTAKAFSKPVFLHAHGCEFHTFHAQLPAAMKYVVNWILKKSTHLIALSESWKDYYMTHCGLTEEQVVVLPNPVELPANLPNRVCTKNCDRYKVKIAFLGRIGKRKGAFDLLQAFAKLAPEVREKAQLILAGIGEVEQARSLAESLNIEKNVSFLGWVDPQGRSKLLSEVDAFTLPSYNEGLPMALLEAMSWGLPAITTPVGGIPEVITHSETGLLVNPGDVSQLADALQTLIENESIRLKLGSAARRRVAPLDVKAYSRSLFNYYCSALEANTNRNAERSLPSVVANDR